MIGRLILSPGATQVVCYALFAAGAYFGWWLRSKIRN